MKYDIINLLSLILLVNENDIEHHQQHSVIANNYN